MRSILIIVYFSESILVLGVFAYKIFPSKIMKTFFGMTSKMGFRVFFCKHWAPFYEIKQGWAPFLPGYSEVLPRFSWILPGFSINENFCHTTG